MTHHADMPTRTHLAHRHQNIHQTPRIRILQRLVRWYTRCLPTVSSVACAREPRAALGFACYLARRERDRRRVRVDVYDG